VARILCHKSMQADIRAQADRLLRLPGSTLCRFLCGEKVMGQAEIWKSDDTIFKRWRIRVTDSAGVEKIVKSASPKRVLEFIQNRLAMDTFRCPDEVAAPALSRRRRKYDLPY
jgi:hypothetical protein